MKRRLAALVGWRTICYRRGVSSGKQHRRHEHSHKRGKEKERYYLFPGQGGPNYWAKQRRFIFWSCVVAILGGTILGAIMIMIYHMKPMFR